MGTRFDYEVTGHTGPVTDRRWPRYGHRLRIQALDPKGAERVWIDPCSDAAL